MAATASELRRIYSYLLGEHDRPERLPALQAALASVARDDTTTRTDADRQLTIANGGVNPELTFTQHRAAIRQLLVWDGERILSVDTDGVALLWGSARLIDLAYRELTSPFDVSTPIVVRVLRGAPEAIAAIASLSMDALLRTYKEQMEGQTA